MSDNGNTPMAATGGAATGGSGTGYGGPGIKHIGWEPPGSTFARPPPTGGIPLPPQGPTAPPHNHSAVGTPIVFPTTTHNVEKPTKPLTIEEEEEQENVGSYHVTTSVITVAKILADKPSLNFAGIPLNFRTKESIDYILSYPDVVKVFYIATHGQAIDSFYTCPPNTLLIQPGAGEFCYGKINTKYEPVLLSGTNFAQLLYEMLGLCKKPSLKFLSTLYYTTTGEATPDKYIYIKNTDLKSVFGVYYVNQTSGFVELITDEELYKPLMAHMTYNSKGELIIERGGTTVSNYIKLINELFPGSINVCYFSSCSSLSKEMAVAKIADMWKFPTHGSMDSSLIRTLDCGEADKETQAFFSGDMYGSLASGAIYGPSSKVTPGPGSNWVAKEIGYGPHVPAPNFGKRGGRRRQHTRHARRHHRKTARRTRHQRRR